MELEVNEVEIKEAMVIKMDTNELKSGKSLLPKKEIAGRKEKGLRV
ncbi:MAG: hypothetical protein IPL04_08560 [Chitinophagaceae bacterium]|nr:hypothetical protein [Chitinophagaceae bacterium]